MALPLKMRLRHVPLAARGNNNIRVRRIQRWSGRRKATNAHSGGSTLGRLNCLEQPRMRTAGSVQWLDRPHLLPLLALSNLHPHTLTFCQPAQPAAFERRHMDEYILPTVVPTYEAEPLLGVVPLYRTDT